MDDLKISHLLDAEIDKLMDYLRSEYGDGLVVHKGDLYDYLGVDHDYLDHDNKLSRCQ
jgi:hypothetical protein